MILGTCLALLVGAFMITYRAIRGPTTFDRVLAVNALGTKTVLLVALLGFFANPAFYLDTALAYALINFIATLAILKFVEKGRIG